MAGKTRKLKLVLGLAWMLGLAAPVWAEAPAAVLGQNDLPIHDAARIGARADVERLLKANPAHREARTALGWTPLHLAATNPDPGPLQALLAAGAEVGARDAEGATPLHLAAYANKVEHSRLLLHAGADVNIKTHSGRDVLSLARKMRADETAGVISLWVLKGCKPRQAGC